MRERRFIGRFTVVLAAALLSAAGSVRGGDLFYIQQRMDIRPSSKLIVIKPPSALDRFAEYDQFWKADAKGGNPVPVWDTRDFIRAVSASPDGKRVVCNVAGDHEPFKFASTLVVLNGANGSVLRTIKFVDHDVRVVGAVAFIPGSERLGLTICKLTDIAATKAGKSLAAKPGSKEDFDLGGARTAARAQWKTGEFPSQPMVATIDPGGKDLKVIGPGAFPVWSADGKTILATNVRFEPPDSALPQGCRLVAMDADGSNRRFVGPLQSACGAFGQDGKRILYVVSAGRAGSEMFHAAPDGTGAEKVPGPAGLYASPRPGGAKGVIEVFYDSTTSPTAGAKAGPPVKGAPPEPERYRCPVLLENGTVKRIGGRPDGNTFIHTLDEDAHVFVDRLPSPEERRAREAAAGGPTRKPGGKPGGKGGNAGVKPLPEGTTLEFEGSEVFFRDQKTGKRSIPPDGRYRWNGMIMIIKDGERYLED